MHFLKQRYLERLKERCGGNVRLNDKILSEKGSALGFVL